MTLTTQDLASKHNKNYEAIKKIYQRASQKGLNYILLDGECYYFFYENGLGRGGRQIRFIKEGENEAEEDGKECGDSRAECGAGSGEYGAERGEQAVTRKQKVSSVGVSDGSLDIGGLARGVFDEKTKQAEKTIKIKDLEKMHRVKAVNELNSCPKGCELPPPIEVVASWSILLTE